MSNYQVTVEQCTTDLPIKPINRPINRIGKSQISQYRIGIGSADYSSPYRLINIATFLGEKDHKSGKIRAKV